jgi:hypothetical protein
MLPHSVDIFVHDFEHLGEVLAEMVGGSTLDTATTHWNVKLHSSRVLSSCESFILRFSTTDAGTSEELFIDLGVDLLNLKLELSGALVGCVSSMAFLPEELACADEWSGVLELPSDNVGPLVDEKGQVAMRANPLCETGVHDGL